MGHYRGYEDDSQHFSEQEFDEPIEDLPDKRRVRKLLEERLERKKMREELDELDGEFDWDELDK